MTPRRRGRPALGAAPSAVRALRLSAEVDVAVRAIATEHRCTIGEALRHLVQTHPAVRITFTKIAKRQAPA